MSLAQSNPVSTVLVFRLLASAGNEGREGCLLAPSNFHRALFVVSAALLPCNPKRRLNLRFVVTVLGSCLRKTGKIEDNQ
jgi:hypothetical protein